MTKCYTPNSSKMILKVPLGTNVPPFATHCTPKFSLIKVLYILPLLDLIHLQVSCLKSKDTTMLLCTLSRTQFLLYHVHFQVCCTLAEQGLQRTCPIILRCPYSYQWREIFQHFHSFDYTMKKGGRVSHRLSLHTDKEVLLTPSLQWKCMKCSNVGLFHSTLFSKQVISFASIENENISKICRVSRSLGVHLSPLMTDKTCYSVKTKHVLQTDESRQEEAT